MFRVNVRRWKDLIGSDNMRALLAYFDSLWAVTAPNRPAADGPSVEDSPNGKSSLTPKNWEVART